MYSNDEIIDTLEKLRKEQGVSLSELARRVGMAKSALSRYFNRNREFPLNRTDDFAKALHTKPEYILGLAKPSPAHTYTFLPAHVAAGALASVDPITYEEAETIKLSDAIMGKYAGDKDITVMYLSGDSMNRVMPDGSMMAIKIMDGSQVEDGDIVVFSCDGEYAVKRYYNNPNAKIVTFDPDSTDKRFHPIVYRYEDMENVRIVGKVVVYTVVL